MQITTAITVLIAGVASAAPAGNDPHPDGSFGSRYTDHECKKLHSLPNRHFSMYDCLSTETVGSISLTNQFFICSVFDDRHCNGIQRDAVLSWDRKCTATNQGAWKGAKSFKCWMGNN
ncbi:hypothetical protein NLG97_g4929 [Lecanicillium saksenae]|uniref:Uncharacterized protein n=1 Tax=Lecanicillium saksenae TaxID=468837 RepID=A0ACC1QU32_9HYPO|nr:hypothetical protein NLG97_g4929 [Lecanicillium saksenae]